MFELIFNLTLLFLLIFFIFLLTMIWPPDSPWAPNWKTKKNIARKALKLAKVTKKDTVFELGSGSATPLVVAAGEFGANGVGIEIEPSRFMYSKIRVKKNKLGKKITIKRGNFFKEDLSGATVLYLYLVPKTLNRLIPKLRKELKKGTRIISYKYKMNLPVKKVDKENELTLYVI